MDTPKMKAGRPRKYNKEELAEHRREYQRKYYAEHKEAVYAAQKRWRERTRAASGAAVAEAPPTQS